MAVDFVDAQQAEKLSTDDLYTQLQCSHDGLSDDEAASRLDRVGLNALEQEKDSALKRLLSYFWGPIPWMIEAAAVLSLVVQDWNDFIIIMVLLLFNAGIGFWEEYKAANALAALKKGLALKARTKRNGQWSTVEASQLVPGDLVRIRGGDVVPADAKLLEGDYISIDQAALTGESLPVNKKPDDIAYSGSVAKQGEMTALVVATGEHTFFGKTAKLVQSAGAVSHFQKAVMNIGNYLIFLAVGLSIILIGVELYRDLMTQGHWEWDDVIDILQFVLILVIASIPVAMPAVLSVTMALGALALSKEKAIVSRLQAIEEMAGIDVLCSDKTGTLTKNQLTLGDPVPAKDVEPQQCILAGALASKAENEDAIDLAVIGALQDPEQLKAYDQTAFVPFDPISKRTQATVKQPDGSVNHYAKGAPQVIFDLCKLDGDARKQVDDKVHEFATRGFRTLGIAQKAGNAGDDAPWQYLGLLPMSDPPRDDSRDTIEQAKAKGLKVHMVTGDDVAIGAEISGQLGMGTHIVPATEIFGEGADPSHPSAALAERIEKADGFARVFPEHKYGIVKAFQERGHLVAMTGDGVNDAPALKQADCGIAVSGATDAARAAAALILTAPGLSVIIKAIETARQIFERMMSYTIYRIAMTIDIMFFVVFAMLMIPTVQGETFRPLTAVMIILLALLDDIPMMTIAYDRTRIDPEPVKWRMGRILPVSTILGLLAMAQTFGILLLGLAWMHHPEYQSWITMDASHLQSMVFLQLVAGGHLMLFLTRTERFFLRPPLPSPVLFLAIVGTQILAVLLCGFGWLVPQLPWTLIGLVWLYNILWMFTLDFVKLAVYYAMDREPHKHPGHHRYRFHVPFGQSLQG